MRTLSAMVLASSKETRSRTGFFSTRSELRWPTVVAGETSFERWAGSDGSGQGDRRDG